MADIKKIATRVSYGNTLVELAQQGADNLVVFDADLAAATKTEIFRKEYPDRHFDCGIAEQNMVGVAAGMATMGYVPFVSSFAMFVAGRGFEQIRIRLPSLSASAASSATSTCSCRRRLSRSFGFCEQSSFHLHGYIACHGCLHVRSPRQSEACAWGSGVEGVLRCRL